MTTIVTRAGKGSPLTHTEVDTNFTNLNTAKLETAAIPLGTLQAPSVSFLNDSDTGIFCPQGGNSLAIATGAQYAITCTSTQAVGIKTANPQKALHVAGATRVGADDATDAFLEIGEGATGNRNSYIDIVGDTTYTDYGLRFIRNNTGANATSEIKHRGTGNLNFTTQEAGAIVFNTTNSPRVTILPAGNVGIGTSSPSQSLQVVGAIASTGQAPALTSSSTFFDYITALNTARFAAVGNTTGTAAPIYFSQYSSNGSVGRDAVVIDSSGRVGISSTSPQGLLDLGAADSATALAIAGWRAASYNGSILQWGGITASQWSTAAFFTAGSERARIDSSGRLLVGTSTARGYGDGNIPFVQVERATIGGDIANIGVCNNGDNGAGPKFTLAKSRSGSNGGVTVVQNGDSLGSIQWSGADGTDIESVAAQITCNVDGTPGANDMPGRLVFSTTADGASSPTERMRISNNGQNDVFGSSTYVHIARSAQAAGFNYLYLGCYGATNTSNGTASFIVYTNGNVQNTNGSYTTISDKKLKENIVAAGSQWADLKAIQIRNWNFKADTGYETHRQIGPIAQELETICPGLVFETPDRDADGNETGEVTKGVNQSVLYMKAVKALQEAMERIETLEAKVAALENA